MSGEGIKSLTKKDDKPHPWKKRALRRREGPKWGLGFIEFS